MPKKRSAVSKKIFELDIDLAEKFMSPGYAIVAQLIAEELRKNAKKGKNIRLGYYWARLSYQQMVDKCPFFTRARVTAIIGKMVSNKILIREKFSKKTLMQTSWYRFTEEANEFFELEIPAVPKKPESECTAEVQKNAPLKKDLPQTGFPAPANPQSKAALDKNPKRKGAKDEGK